MPFFYNYNSIFVELSNRKTVSPMEAGGQLVGIFFSYQFESYQTLESSNPPRTMKNRICFSTRPVCISTDNNQKGMTQ